MTFSPLAVRAAARIDESLLDVARHAGVPIGNSCGAIGVCARCCIRVIAGAENLTPPTAIEREMSRRRRLSLPQRLACQAIVRGDCEITTTYW